MTECVEGGGKRKTQVECGSVITKQQDPRSDDVVQRHSERYLLPKKNVVQYLCCIFYKILVCLYCMAA